MQNDTKEITRLLAKGADINKADYDGRCPLHIAASEGSIDALKALLAVPGVIVNVLDRWKRTPLQDATSSGHTEAQVLLRAAGAVVVNQALAGILCFAAFRGDAKELKRHYDLGADMTVGDYDSRTGRVILMCFFS